MPEVMIAADFAAGIIWPLGCIRNEYVCKGNRYDALPADQVLTYTIGF